MKNKILFTIIFIVILGIVFFEIFHDHNPSSVSKIVDSDTATTSAADQLPAEALLQSNYYVSQTFNNCGPSALSMALSFYGIQASQQTIADDIRPDNNLTGHNDDKSTSPDQIVQEAEKYRLVAYYLPNGNIQTLKEFISNGIPVITRTFLNTQEDFAHYRVIKGYDDATGEIIDEDGFQGPNARFSYSDFMTLWQPFNYEYVVMVTPDKEALVQKILGKEFDSNVAWQDAVQTAKQALNQNPNSVYASFDLSVALYHTGDYQDSVNQFEQVQNQLSEHALWYQIEPIESYYELGNYSKVFSLSNAILNDGNPAFPELYVLQGESYLKERNTVSAKSSFEQALVYNKNLQSAKDALNSLNN